MDILGLLHDEYGRQAARKGIGLEEFPDAPESFIQGYADELDKMHNPKRANDEYDRVHVSVIF